MAEWSKAADLKSVVQQCTVGSNPISSANNWRDDREADGARLLSECAVKGTEGSNPSLSAETKYALVAQLDRASDYESEGHRFESCRACNPFLG